MNTHSLRETSKLQAFTFLFTEKELTHLEGLLMNLSAWVKGLPFDVDSTTMETTREIIVEATRTSENLPNNINAEAIMAESLKHSPLLAVPPKQDDVHLNLPLEYSNTECTSTGSQVVSPRVAARNTCLAIHFVIRGAEKRRYIAYDKAKTLQRELGVIPRLICVK